MIYKVDKSRIEFLVPLYMSFGLSEEMAYESSFSHMAYVVGLRVLLNKRPEKEYNRALDIALKFLVPAPDTDGRKVD